MLVGVQRDLSVCRTLQRTGLGSEQHELKRNRTAAPALITRCT